MRLRAYCVVWIPALIGLFALGGCVPPLERELDCARCLAKSELAGEWNYRIEAIGGGAKSRLCPAVRAGGIVRFEISEDYLLAWLMADPSSPRYCDPASPSCEGQLVGAWEVHHFDNRTRCPERFGEQLNIIRENPCEPTWYERRYLRVDWSVNFAMPNELDRLTGSAVEAVPVADHVPVPDELADPESELDGPAGTKRFTVDGDWLLRLRSCDDPEAPDHRPGCVAVDLGPVSCDDSRVRLRQVFEQL